MRKLPGFSRWSRAVLCFGLLSSLVAACTFLLDHDKNECNTDGDCQSYAGHPSCQNNVCVTSGLGPTGCFFASPGSPPMTPSDFANQCSTAKCETFNNCDPPLGLCGDAQPAPPVPPPDAAPAGPPVDAPDESSLTSCIGANIITVGGSTAVQPFMTVVAKILGANSPPYQIAYQPSGSCTGVDNIFNAAKQIVKDIPGKQAILFHGDGTQENCTFGAGTMLDVAVSDVFETSCTATYALADTIGEYFGPIQPMTFVVSNSAATTQTAISAEYAHYVFGLSNANASPYQDNTLHFIRNSGSGTQQMMSRAINVTASQWWGIDEGSSGKVASTLEAIAPAKASNAIGILSTDFADAARGQLRVLAFKGSGQTCGYYPDSTAFTKDKANVRDGHYPIWGPVHFYARITDGQPSDAAGALVTRFTLPKLDPALQDAITDIGFVPSCAMQVQRSAEMGPIQVLAPQNACGCYYDARTAGGVAPAGCKACVTSADCTDPSKTACNSGFCEAQ